ncbi:hypothetical protein FQZ97_798110 [compost metagenome]
MAPWDRGIFTILRPDRAGYEGLPGAPGPEPFLPAVGAGDRLPERPRRGVGSEFRRGGARRAG